MKRFKKFINESNDTVNGLTTTTAVLKELFSEIGVKMIKQWHDNYVPKAESLWDEYKTVPPKGWESDNYIKIKIKWDNATHVTPEEAEKYKINDWNQGFRSFIYKNAENVLPAFTKEDSYSGKLMTLRSDYKQELKKVAEESFKAYRDDYISRVLGKLTNILKIDNFINIELLNVRFDGHFQADILFELTTGKFTLHSVLVWVMNYYGTEFTRLPLTFHDVVYPDGSKVKKSSLEVIEQKFAKKFADEAGNAVENKKKAKQLYASIKEFLGIQTYKKTKPLENQSIEINTIFQRDGLPRIVEIKVDKYTVSKSNGYDATTKGGYIKYSDGTIAKISRGNVQRFNTNMFERGNDRYKDAFLSKSDVKTNFKEDHFDSFTATLDGFKNIGSEVAEYLKYKEYL